MSCSVKYLTLIHSSTTPTMGRLAYACLGFLLVVSLALFFGFFFGLNYPEIVRHGWPVTRCAVLNSAVTTRYCCETSCATASCQNAPVGSPQCSSLISSIASGYSPSACSSNSSSCPPQIGSTCNGGYYCCTRCCQTCKSCTTSCKKGVCSQSCNSYPCNFSCCSESTHLSCTLSCPICYTVSLQLRYSSRDGKEHNISYAQDFSKDADKADAFFNRHMTNSTSNCWYNPANDAQVLLDISFTVWKWVVTSIFGILPLTITLGSIACYLVWKFAESRGYMIWAKPFVEKISLTWDWKSKAGISNVDFVEKTPDESAEKKAREEAD
ncbi:hypothetical protein B0H19DRAFT_1140313 [Mycena capillaripes]|nr:hypothetical protein B0H19DRAFT_1140313 [Mycena capillaripes]